MMLRRWRHRMKGSFFRRNAVPLELLNEVAADDGRNEELKSGIGKGMSVSHIHGLAKRHAHGGEDAHGQNTGEDMAIKEPKEKRRSICPAIFLWVSWCV